MRCGSRALSLAAELGVKAKFDTALATLLTYEINPRFALDALVALQIDVATKSNIILDPYAETYYLGSVLSQHGPSLLADYVRLSHACLARAERR